MSLRHVLATLVVGMLSMALHADSVAPYAYIISPQDGATVGRTFTVKFGLSGFGVAPAGVDLPNTGHHHLLIDVETLPPSGMPMGKDVRHFGGGQTEATITLEPGQHTLQLMLGDKAHVPFDPPVISEKITITVE